MARIVRRYATYRYITRRLASSEVAKPMERTLSIRRREALRRRERSKRSAEVLAAQLNSSKRRRGPTALGRVACAGVGRVG